MAAHRIRILAESKNDTGQAADVLTKDTPFWYRGSDLEIEFALSQNGQFVIPADVDTIHVAVKAEDATANTTPLMLATLEAADVDGAFTPELWTAGTGQLAVASFTRAEAALEAGFYQLIIVHTDTSGNRNTHLYCRVRVIEDQHDSVALPAPLPLSVSQQVSDLLDAITENGNLVAAANQSVVSAEASAASAAAVLHDLATTVFPTATIGALPGSWTGDVTITLTDGQTIFLTDSAPPYLEPNTYQFEGTGSTWEFILENLVHIIMGDVIDRAPDPDVTYGQGTVGVFNYVPFQNLYAEFKDDNIGKRLELTYMGENPQNLVLPGSLIVISNGTFTPIGNVPFILKTVQALTAQEKANVRESIFGDPDNIDVPGLLTAGAQDVNDPLSVHNRQQLFQEFTGFRGDLAHVSLGACTAELENSATSTSDDGNSATITLTAPADQAAIRVQTNFASGRGSGLSSRFDLVNAILGFSVERTLADGMTVFAQIGVTSNPKTATPVEADTGTYLEISRSGADYTWTLYHQRGTAGTNNSTSVVRALDLDHRTRVEVRFFTTGAVEVHARTNPGDHWSKILELTGLDFSNYAPTSSSRVWIGGRSDSYTGSFAFALSHVYTIH